MKLLSLFTHSTDIPNPFVSFSYEQMFKNSYGALFILFFFYKSRCQKFGLHCYIVSSVQSFPFSDIRLCAVISVVYVHLLYAMVDETKTFLLITVLMGLVICIADTWIIIPVYVKTNIGDSQPEPIIILFEISDGPNKDSKLKYTLQKFEKELNEILLYQ